jgi:hypothetical protein
MNPLTQSKNATILPVLIALTLGSFGLSPQARAVCQEGCDLDNNNTVLGDDALVNNTTGIVNTLSAQLHFHEHHRQSQHPGLARLFQHHRQF